MYVRLGTWREIAGAFVECIGVSSDDECPLPSLDSADRSRMLLGLGGVRCA